MFALTGCKGGVLAVLVKDFGMMAAESTLAGLHRGGGGSACLLDLWEQAGFCDCLLCDV